MMTWCHKNAQANSPAHAALDYFFFPACQVRVTRFYQRCIARRFRHARRLRLRRLLLRLLTSSRLQWALPDFICQLQIAVGTAGLHLPAPDRSGHCRTSTASSRSQWALPGFSSDFQIPVGTAGLQPRAPNPSGHCRTSAATSRSQWALPDCNREPQIAVGTAGLQLRAPDRSGHCRTSTCVHAR